MKTQGTKLVARIAMALLAGMMVLALASCGSKNPLKGHTYENEYGQTMRFTEKECMFRKSDSNEEETYSYTLNSETLTGTFYSGGQAVPFSYREDGSSISFIGITFNKVK